MVAELRAGCRAGVLGLAAGVHCARGPAMHVLMLCVLEVWALPDGGGAPSLYRTLRAYGERGHRVTFVAPTIGANRLLPSGRLRGAQPWAPPELPGIHYERFHLPSLQESRLPLP